MDTEWYELPKAVAWGLAASSATTSGSSASAFRGDEADGTNGPGGNFGVGAHRKSLMFSESSIEACSDLSS